MPLTNPNAIPKEEMLEALDKLRERIASGDITKAYIVWTGQDGENYDDSLGYGLVELTGVMETAKHMQLQSYVQATLEGLDLGHSAEEMAEKLHTIFNVKKMDDLKDAGIVAQPPLEWDELPAEDRNFWVAAVRTVIQAS